MIALLAIAACTKPEAEARVVAIDQTNVVTHVVTVPTTTTETTTRPSPEAVACAEKRSGVICTYAGIPHVPQFSAEGLPRLQSPLYLPIDLTFGPVDGQPYILDFNNHRIRTVLPDDRVVTVAGTGFLGDGIFDDQTATWGGGDALDFSFNHPTGVAFDPLDPAVMYVAAWHNSRVLRDERYDLEYYAGTGARAYGDGDPDGDGVFLASDAIFNYVASVAFDDAGALYASDQVNFLIRRIDRDGTISTVAGSPGAAGFAGDGGPAADALLANNFGGFADPQGTVVFHEGALFVADTENQVIRRIDLSTDLITTVAGSYLPTAGLDTDGDGQSDLIFGDPGYAGDGGPATAARLDLPHDVAFDGDGTMYIADTGNNCIRSVDPAGTIDTFAGRCVGRPPDLSLDLGDGGDPLDATFNHPSGVEVDGAGNVYVADQDDHVIRVVWK